MVLRALFWAGRSLRKVAVGLALQAALGPEEMVTVALSGRRSGISTYQKPVLFGGSLPVTEKGFVLYALPFNRVEWTGAGLAVLKTVQQTTCSAF